MQKREANFTLLFRHWLKANPMESAAFELKQTRTDSLPFSDVKDHQLEALLASKGSGLLYKAPDDSRGIKPYDLFYLRKAGAYVVIRYPSCFVLIDAAKFALESARSKRRSLTSKRARALSTVAVDIP